MSFVTNLPTIKVQVNRNYLNKELYGWESAYLVAAHCRNGRPILFTVHLESGALYSGLPIEAVMCDRYEGNESFSYDPTLMITETLQPFSCLEGPVQAITYEHLKGCAGQFKIGDTTMPGHYLFTIDYAGSGLAEDPEQYKTHNIIQLDNYHLAALPNNHCLFQDNFFTVNDKGWPRYARNTKYWTAGG